MTEAPETPTRQIRARHDAETITVYQAFSPHIAGPAAEHGRFPAAFKRERMTWIKPSFLWMMYRSSWADAPGQERVLAIDITLAGFHQALGQAALSSYQAAVHASQDDWKRELRRSSTRVQWDPERDLQLRALPHRSLQLGLQGPAVAAYLDEWIVRIADATPTAHHVHRLLREGEVEGARALLPEERPYQLPEDIGTVIGAS